MNSLFHKVMNNGEKAFNIKGIMKGDLWEKVRIMPDV